MKVGTSLSPEMNETPNNNSAITSASTITKPMFPVVLWKFTRPHTLIGSFLAIPSLHALAAPSFQSIFTLQAFNSIMFAMVPSLLMNLYITGLNQITDIEIDKVNKPDLPIAAGILSKRDAIITVLVALIVSLSLGAVYPLLQTRGLNVALWGSAILGTLYSLPPFRLKRFPALAAFCIVAVRGAIINAAFFAHAKVAAFGAEASTGGVLNCLLSDPKCLWSSTFFAVFGIVIALMKDVPDVAGDEEANVRTFSVRIGQKRVFTATRRLLTGLFVAVGFAFCRSSAGAVINAKSMVLAVSRGAVGIASFACGLSVRKKAQGVDPEDSKQVYKYYMHLWKLFYASYLALPFVR